MKKADLTKRLAKRSHLTEAAAADQVDRVVHEILKRVRKNQAANLPGLGTFAPGQEKTDFGFEASSKKPGGKP